MDEWEWLAIALLYLVGSVLLICELFVPAHGLLGLIGLGVLGFGLYRTFMISETAGVVGILVLAVVLPTGLVLAVRNWHRTPVGRRVSPANPVLDTDDRMPVEEIEALIGSVGRSVTPLRPVGTCIFSGRRVECVSEHGMIRANEEVEAVRLKDRSLAVRVVSRPEEGEPSA